MNVFGIGTGELILILIIAALVVGPEKMVKMAGDAGKLIARLRQESDRAKGEFQDALQLDDTISEVKGAFDEARAEIEGVQKEVTSSINDVQREVKQVEREVQVLPREASTAVASVTRKSTPKKAASTYVPADQHSEHAEALELDSVEIVPEQAEEVGAVDLSGEVEVIEDSEEEKR